MLVYYHKAMCHAEKLVHYLQCQGHSEGLYKQKMTIFIVSSKLLVRLQPNLVWWYIIISRSVLCKIWITVFKVKVAANVWNVSECLSGQYLLNHWSFRYQTWYGNAASWARVWYRKKWLAAFNVKVTARAYIIKMWLFLHYLLNCWSICNQTWFGSTAS